MELLVIGFDGLSYNMLREFDVDTPFLSSVRADGIAGDLHSVDTPTTLPAWTSFATGKDPGSHGVATMLQQSPDYTIAPATCNMTDAAVYDLLDDAVFVNLPASVERTPAGENTKLVSSILASDPQDAVPASLQSLDAFEEYEVHDDGSLKANPEAYVGHLRDVTHARHAFAREAFASEDPRVGFILFSTPDWVGHFLQFGSDEVTRGKWFRSIVELCDTCAADLADEAENVLILSDHGFEHKPKAIHLQTWLEQKGYLTTAADQSPLQRIVTGAARQVAKRFDTLFDILRTAYLRAARTDDGELLGDVVDFNPDVDFESSRAWQLRYGCLYINDDRFDAGTVTDSETLRTELRDGLASLTDDDDGNPVFDTVAPLEKAYTDPDPKKHLPDLIARPRSGYLPLRAFSPTGDPVIDKPGHAHYDHRYRGLVAAEGPLFASRTDVEGASLVDVVPTLLHALGEPLLPDFDGEVRMDLLATDREPTFRNESDVPTPQTRTGDESEREAVAREQLRDLGYME